MYRVTLVVGGGRCSEFPIDMLRYDNLCPATEADSLAIRQSCQQIWPPVEGMKRIMLTRTLTNKKWYPTERRWHSFGWSILKFDIFKIGEGR